MTGNNGYLVLMKKIVIYKINICLQLFFFSHPVGQRKRIFLIWPAGVLRRKTHRLDARNFPQAVFYLFGVKANVIVKLEVDHQQMSLVKSQILVLHVMNLTGDHNESKNQQNGKDKLGNHQRLSQNIEPRHDGSDG